MANIGLVDVDGHNFPNLALMKIAAWHKKQGDSVTFALPLLPYDRIYMAKVFTFTPDDLIPYQAPEIISGGTGYDMAVKLPDEIEHEMPDYSMYGITDTAYGYLSRGCPRRCPFCIVAAKEGPQSYKVADLREWWNGQKRIKLLDPNILACPDWENLLGQLAFSGAVVDFNQGIDIRLMTDEKAAAINKVRYEGLHFAWDNAADKITPVMLKEYRAIWKTAKHAPTVYVLTNFNSTLEQDFYRIYALKEMGYKPYVMIYDKPHAPKQLLKMQRWVNNPAVWYKCATFEEYNE